MCSVTHSMSVSLDGYIVGPDCDFDWTVGRPATVPVLRAQQHARNLSRLRLSAGRHPPSSSKPSATSAG